MAARRRYRRNITVSTQMMPARHQRWFEGVMRAVVIMDELAESMLADGEQGLAEHAEVGSDCLQQLVEDVYHELNEGEVEYHEGLDTELQMAQAWERYKVDDGIYATRPEELPGALRGILADGGFSWDAVNEVSDEQLLEDARSAYDRRARRGR